MIPWGPIAVLICMVALPVHYWQRMFADDPKYGKRWLISWFIRGVALPIFVWVLLNMGSHPVMPAVVRPTAPPSPTVALQGIGMLPVSIPVVIPGSSGGSTASAPASSAQSNWFVRLIEGIAYVSRQTRPAIVVVSSYWAALTMAWFVVLKSRQAEDMRSYVVSSLVWCALSSPIVAIMLYMFGLGGAGIAALVFVWPLMYQSSILEPNKDEPPVLSYGAAVASLKFGKYREAEEAIIAELEKSETDFDGWMMLAELYARQFDDLGEAERTIMEISRDPATPLPQVAVALNRLADWHLQLRDDPLSARRALEEIRRRMPHTHLARMAGLRLDQLPLNSEELREKRKAKKFQLPALGDTIDEAAEPIAADKSLDEPLAQANRCVERLKRDPNDVLAREKLARIFAEQMGQVELAIEQLELLVEMPEQPPAKLAEWLGLMAAWQIRHRGNREAGRRLLQRIVHEHPQSVQAFAAQRRLSLLEVEDRTKSVVPPVVGRIQPTIGPG